MDFRQGRENKNQTIFHRKENRQRFAKVFRRISRRETRTNTYSNRIYFQNMIQEIQEPQKKFSYMSFGGLKEKSEMKFRPRYKSDDIIRVVCDYYGVGSTAFIGRGRHRRLVTERFVAA